jgi:hypothetical protein
MPTMRAARSLTLLLTLAAASAAAQRPANVAPQAANAVEAGELVVEPPTLINLGFEWWIEGDDNRNASVAVSFRVRGATDWRPALPLLRLHGERIYSESRVDVVAPNMFAGSILDLKPDTEYEARFVMSDPDGARGETERTTVVRTRAEPMRYRDGRVFHVYPHGFTGKKTEPSFEGLMCAYNEWCAGTDWATSGRPRVRPGDTILVHAGVYQYNRYEYTNDAAVNRTTPLDGTYYLTADGTPERPISIVAAGDGDVIFDGNGNYALFDVRAADYTYFEGIIFRNAEVAILAGTQFIAGSKGLTVKRSLFERVGAGVFTNWSGSSGFYIADNVFLGRNDPTHLIGWAGDMWMKFRGVEGQVFPPVMASRREALRPRARGRAQLHRGFPRRHQRGTYGSGRPGGVRPRHRGRPGSIRRASTGTCGPSRSTSTATTSPTATNGSRRTAACTTSASCGTRSSTTRHARSLQSADARRPVLLDPQDRASLAGRLHAAHERCGGRAVLQQHDSFRDASGRYEHGIYATIPILGENAAPEIFNVTTFTPTRRTGSSGLTPSGERSAAAPPEGVPADWQRVRPHRALFMRGSSPRSRTTSRPRADKNSVLVDYDVFVNAKARRAAPGRSLRRRIRISPPAPRRRGDRRGGAADRHAEPTAARAPFQWALSAPLPSMPTP